MNRCDQCVTLKFQNRIQHYQYDTVKKQWPVLDPQPSLHVNQGEFKLSEFHLHQKGEHKLNGSSFPLEIHFVYLDALGNGLVLGFVAKRAKKSSSLFEKLLNNESLRIPKLQNYWIYTGSLTSPPNAPSGVSINWFVARNKLKISKQLLAQFKPLSKPAKPLEERAGRSIGYCSCTGFESSKLS